MGIQTSWLGQAGLRLEHEGSVVYVDPYLSDSVESVEGPDFRRLVAAPMAPEAVTDADFVLVTHGHIDHCDPDTLPALAQASPDARFLAPAELAGVLSGFGIDESRVLLPDEKWIDLCGALRVHPVPAAHPDLTRDPDGQLRHLGFVIDCGGRRIYHAGDTSPHEEILRALAALAPIHVAVLPVNELNFFRTRMGIIGNMSVREAFGVAEEIGAELLVPVHWDMFAANSVHPNEIRALYEACAPGFELRFAPEEV